MAKPASSTGCQADAVEGQPDHHRGKVGPASRIIHGLFARRGGIIRS